MKANSIFFMSISLIALFWSSIVGAQDVLNGNASLEFKRVTFPERRPKKNESYVDLDVILDRAQRETLGELLQALKNNPTIGAKIIGFSDRHECRARECDELSLRRARLVFDWLLRNGVPAMQLKGPIGESTNYPLDDGDANDGRALNRRVQLEPYALPKKEPGKKDIKRPCVMKPARHTLS